MDVIRSMVRNIDMCSRVQDESMTRYRRAPDSGALGKTSTRSKICAVLSAHAIHTARLLPQDRLVPMPTREAAVPGILFS